MDKYQKELIGKKSDCILFRGASDTTYDLLKTEIIVLKEDKDLPPREEYSLTVSNPAVGECYLVKDGEIQKFFETVTEADEVPQRRIGTAGRQKATVTVYKIRIDFSDVYEYLHIVFKNDLADDLIIPLRYEPVDREQLKREQTENLARIEREKRIAQASVVCRTGLQLVNIYFRPCCESYVETEIRFYLSLKESDNKTENNEANNRLLNKRLLNKQKVVPKSDNKTEDNGANDRLLFKKQKVVPDEFYVTLSGLAPGKYGFILSQSDEAGNLLMETDYTEFIIGSEIADIRDMNFSIGNYMGSMYH